MNESALLTVTQLNQHIKELLDSDPFLDKVLVRGELSNYKIYPSGHHYFSLKDANGAIRCVMFKGSAFRLRFQPKNGMGVICTGRASPRNNAPP